MIGRTVPFRRWSAVSIPSVARQALIALAGSLFVALSAQVAVYLPFSPVPITGQTFGVLVVGLVLGSRLGSAAILAYLAQGLIGLPVFAPGATLGIARLLSPTGGYLIGFVLAAWLVGRIADAGWRRSTLATISGLVAGTLAIYACGVAGLALYLPIDQAIALGVVPFLAGDALKIVLAVPAVLLKRR